jgi:PST family polysaccharide transporter
VFACLARLLNPHAFGIVALAGVYVAFIQILVTQGFGSAIVQRSALEEEHLDSAFWIAMATAAIFCVLSIALSDFIAHLFKQPEIAPVIRWLSFSIPFYALSSVPSAILTRNLDFRALAVRSLAATSAGGAVGVSMAFFGCGVWSLVGQQLVSACLSTICLWSTVLWRPRLRISKQHMRDLYGFSLGVAGNDILWFFSQKSDQTVVGYFFGASGLGPYALASKLTTLAYEGVAGPFSSVAFPAFSKLQSKPLEFEKALHKFCEMLTFLCLPLFVGLAAVAPELVPLLFGSKWVAAVPLLQVLSYYGALRVILVFVNPFMLAKGRAGLYLLMNVTLTILTFAGCLVAARWSPEAVAISVAASLFAFSAIFVTVASRFLQLKALPLMRSFAFPMFCSFVMLVAVTGIRSLVVGKLAPVAVVLICVLTGALCYLSLAYLLRPDLVKAIYGMIRGSLLPSSWRKSTDPSRIEDDLERVAVASTEL